MGDLFVGNLDLTILRQDHIKLVAQANIQARTIRIIELQEEIARCENDIFAAFLYMISASAILPRLVRTTPAL